MTLGDHIEKNLGAIVTGMIVALISYVVGTTQTAGTIKDLTSRVERLERRVDASATYHNCATRHFDMIERGEHGAAPCTLDGM